MHSPTKTIPLKHVVVLCSLFFFPFSSSSSDPRTAVSGLFCGVRSNSSTDPNYIPTFVEDMQSLSLKLTTRRFATQSMNSTPSNSKTNSTSVFALVQCHKDLSPSDCQLCYAIARTRLPRCLPSSSARIFLDGCFLRYETYEFYQEPVSEASDRYSCSNDTVLDPQFGFRVSETAARVAVRNGGFGVAGESGAYALAQCWESLGKEACRVCLEKAVGEVKRCVSRREGRAMNSGCYLRFSDHKFYNAHGKFHGFYNKGVIVAIVLTMSAFVMLILLATYVIIVKVSKTKQEQRNLGLVSKKFNNSKTKFKYETLEKATDYFSTKKQLGQGGNGTVFLGILPNGENVAVKRLVFNTREWVEEFFNEVNLISGIEHKNLVKLLGCSIEGPESLLVYEYVPNKSLDNFLFDESKSKALNWSQRLNIILGTAEGLAYLHGGNGSPVRIIHRDIKTSNVLLDDNLNPKIADFSLVRCLGIDKTHLSTGIAGTLGYMAPEYVVRGQLTEKADVYSFGVLVLEISCGARNNVFVPGTGHILQRVWNLFRLNRLVEALDPCLKDELLQVQGSEAEICKLLRVGLLCTQASPSLRPSMEEVIRMLTETEYPIPSPTTPPFLRISSLSTDPECSSTISCSTNSTTMVKTDQASYTSSDSSTTRGS
uniref:Cysteine-rich receptor-like protein kinase 42 n=4 Tax=Noccaea caerulescens TaxID=107243 RepID=A0A1J3D659_NOCCA